MPVPGVIVLSKDLAILGTAGFVDNVSRGGTYVLDCANLVIVPLDQAVWELPFLYSRFVGEPHEAD